MLRRLAIVVLSLLAPLLALELLFRLLPVSQATYTGYYFNPDLLSYPAYRDWVVSTGWDLRNAQHLHSNNLGFVQRRDFLPDRNAVALIGDSYVEASMLDEPSRPANQIEQRLRGARNVYGMGSPGTALLDYAQRVRLAHRELQVDEAVVWLEAGDARQALCGSGNVQSRCLDRDTLAPRIERLPPPNLAKRIARQSALAQYLFSQLKVDPKALAAKLLQRQTPSEPAATPASAAANAAPAEVTARSRQVVDAVLANFFAEIASERPARLIFVVDGNREGRGAQPTELELERDYMIERLRAHGEEVVDLEPAFAEHNRHSRLSLNVGPYDRHLNAMGVGLVSDQIVARLRQPPPAKP